MALVRIILFLSQIVNRTLKTCVNDEAEVAFSATELSPSEVIAQSFQTLQHVTDLSLATQLYILTYYNTCNGVGAMGRTGGAVAALNLSGSYKLGSPVLYPDPTYPSQLALWICNTTVSSGSAVTNPSLQTEDWLYAGPFLTSTYNSAYTYSIGDLASYNGILYTAVVNAPTGVPANSTTANPNVTGAQWASVFYITQNQNPGATNPNAFMTQLLPSPAVATTAPVFVQDTISGDYGNTFSIRLDSYGYGTLDDIDTKSPLRAFVRDSWGLLNGYNPAGTNTFLPGRVFDEYMFMQGNTAFINLFNGFPVKCLQYTNPLTGVQSAYWDFLFVNDPTQVLNPTSAPATAALRNTNPDVYWWSFTSSQTSRYSCWSPVQSIVIELTNVPIDDQPVSDNCVLTNTDQQNVLTSGKTRRIIAEFYPARNPSEGTVIYSPQIHRNLYMISGSSLKSFSYQISWRNRLTNELVPLKLSSGGSANVVFKFNPKP